MDQFENMNVESKRVDEFANMSDEELRQYVYGNRAVVRPRWRYLLLRRLPCL